MASDNEETMAAPENKETKVVSELEERMAKLLCDESRIEENTVAVAPDSEESTAVASDIEEGTIASNNEESMSRRLWDKFRNESFIALHNPFMVGLASGNLQSVTFYQFLNEELHLLKCYTQALALAVVYSDDEYSKISIKILIEELKKLDDFLKLGNYYRARASTTTVKYTNFLLKTASKKVTVHTLSALIPHLQLYAFIGKELRSVLESSGATHHPFMYWINYYSSDSFQVSTFQAMVLLDKLCVPLNGEDLDIIQRLYSQAMKFELDCFIPHPVVQETLFPRVAVPLLKELNSSDRHLLLFSSFDLTCTVVDSSDILERITIEKAMELDQVQSQDQTVRISAADLRNKWELLRREYREEYGRCIKSIVKAEYEITTDAEKNYEVMKKALEQLSEFEKMANTRVIESGVLKGLNLEDIKRAGEGLILQDDCISFFQSIIKNENTSASIHVLSYCWCADLIKSVFSSGDLHNLNIQANELRYQESVSTGGMVRKVESPFDKVERFGNIIEQNRRSFSVYIGHSVGDFLCLLRADIGIVIGSNDRLRKVGDSFGICFAPILHAFTEMQKEMVGGRRSGSLAGRPSGYLYTVSCWAEIQSLFVGLKPGFGHMEASSTSSTQQ